MSVKASDDKQAIRYLLGELTEAEQARLEERFFHNSELSELLSEAEDDLIDQYVRKELSGRERERFERHFLVSERRREKVEFSRALLQAERALAVEDSYRQKPLSWWNAILSATRAPRPALSYALAAAALLFLLGGSWLYSEIRQLRREVAQMEAERAARERQNDELSAQVIEQRRRSGELAAEKESVEQELALLKQKSDGRAEGTGTTGTLLSFILSPGYRGTEGPKNLVLPRSAEIVRLQLSLNSGDEYRSYRVRLQTANGKMVRSWNNLKASPTRGERGVFISLPAEALDKGVQYELTLSGVTNSGQVEDLGYYYFNLLKD
jgi:hypothetical protein